MMKDSDGSENRAVRLQSPAVGRSGVGFLSLLFVGGITLVSLLGAYGPAVWHNGANGERQWVPHDSDGNKDCSCTSGCSYKHTYNVENMKHTSQVLYLKLQLQRAADNNDRSYEFNLDTNVNVYACNNPSGVSCDTADSDTKLIIKNLRSIKKVSFEDNEDFSSDFSLFSLDSIDYDSYQAIVEITDTDDQAGTISPVDDCDTDPSVIYAKVHIANVYPAFTKWAMGWKIVFNIVTLLAMFSPITCYNGLVAGFFVQMRNVPFKLWSDMQCWIAVLLVGLFFFNDPLFPLQVYSSSESTTNGLMAFEVVSTSAFIAALLCFMLCTSEDIASEGMSQYLERKGIGYYVPKTILCGALWILIMVFYAIARLYNTGSPEFDDLADNKVYFAFEIILGIFLAIWAAWFAVHMIKSTGKVCSASLPYAFLFYLTTAAAILAIVGVAVGALYPLPSNAFSYIFFYGCFNMYVWLLAFSYAPEKDDAVDGMELAGGGELYEGLIGGEDGGAAQGSGRGMI